MKKYRVIFFDWDGTAVLSRTAPADEVLPPLIALLRKGVSLVIISGTTYENIAGGTLSALIPAELLPGLYLGLGRGAFNYGFDPDGSRVVKCSLLPDARTKSLIHELSFLIHKHLLETYDYETDIVFSRPNYCKIDLLVNLDRKGKLYLQPGEVDMVSRKLGEHGFGGGIGGLIAYSIELGRRMGLRVMATSDAKYLEVGLSTKSDNIDYFLKEVFFPLGITIEECCFWGDEFTFLADGIRGSDAFMITDLSRGGDFFDVSERPIALPAEVRHEGGGVSGFLRFLSVQAGL